MSEIHWDGIVTFLNLRDLDSLASILGWTPSFQYHQKRRAAVLIQRILKEFFDLPHMQICHSGADAARCLVRHDSYESMKETVQRIYGSDRDVVWRYFEIYRELPALESPDYF